MQKQAEILYGLYQSIRRASPMPIGEYNELVVLVRLQQAGALRITAIAEAEGLTQPGATTVVRRLTSKGYAEQTVDEADARATLVTITAKGSDHLQETKQHRIDMLAAAIAKLSVAQQATLATADETLHALTQNLTPEEG